MDMLKIHIVGDQEVNVLNVFLKRVSVVESKVQTPDGQDFGVESIC
jgi:hypothetical protein